MHTARALLALMTGVGLLVASVAPSASQSTAPQQPPVGPASGVAMKHTNVGCVVAGRFPKLQACFSPGANVGRAEVHFRALDGQPWFGVQMQSDGACHSAILPKPLGTTKEIQYYLNVVDRTFSETRKPAGAPDGAYRVRVVAREGDCRVDVVVARTVKKLATPITVFLAKDAAGGSIAAVATQAAIAPAMAVGFSSEGAAVAAAVGTAGTTAGATTPAVAAGGVSTKAVALAAIGAAAVGGGVAVAATRGDESDWLTGHWVGTGNDGIATVSSRPGHADCSTEHDVNLDITQSGSGLSGRGTAAERMRVGSCSPEQGPYALTLTGSVSGSNVTMTVTLVSTVSGGTATAQLSGTATANRMSGTTAGSVRDETFAGTWAWNRQ